jgi:hypothetical protein
MSRQLPHKKRTIIKIYICTMELELRKKPIGVFPVEGLYRVYENEGKQFKSKILAIACFDDNDEGIIFETIETSDIISGYIQLHDKPINTKGIINENNDWVELDPKDYLK